VAYRCYSCQKRTTGVHNVPFDKPLKTAPDLLCEHCGSSLADVYPVGRDILKADFVEWSIAPKPPAQPGRSDAYQCLATFVNADDVGERCTHRALPGEDLCADHLYIRQQRA